MGSDKKHHHDSGPTRAVFLDRDGTINHDPGYLSDSSLLKLLPGVGEGLKNLQDAGMLLVVVSNQSGVGRGLITLEQIVKIHERLDEFLRAYGVKINHYELCFHRPEEDCACRKPKTQLLLNAASRLQIDVSKSFMVGDKASDVQCGQNAGCQGSILVLTGEGSKTHDEQSSRPDYVAKDLLAASGWILSQLDFS